MFGFSEIEGQQLAKKMPPFNERNMHISKVYIILLVKSLQLSIQQRWKGITPGNVRTNIIHAIQKNKI